MFILFILREREGSTSRGGAEIDEERERIQSRLHAISVEPNVGLELMYCEIMT